MTKSELTDVEALLKKRFSKEDADKVRIPSTATADARETRVDQLLLDDSQRARMPLTKSQYLVRDNPHLVQWERETRKFLRKLSPDHEHRVAAVMIYEWATGIKLADLAKLEAEARERGEKLQTSYRSELRHINKILRHYFGDKSYSTWIAGRKVARCYKVRAGFLIRRRRPLTLTLWAEYGEGVLYP